MKIAPEATHRHKRLGAVVVLQMGSELAKIVMTNGDEFWVKVSELTDLSVEVVAEPKSSKKQAKAARPAATVDSRLRVAHVA
jgi:hypothetical protein